MTTTADNNFSMALPADQVHGPKQGYWTFDEYAALPDDGKRYEIMNGVLVMIPTPEPDHQSAIALLAYYLLQVIEFKGLGRVFPGPVDVRLTSDRVVQPDVLVVLNANLHKIARKYVVGGPDLAVEVASPGTAIYDCLSKFEAYEQAGVPEYWIVHPQEKTVEVLVLEDKGYESLGTFRGKDTLPSRVVPGITHVAVEQFFFAD
jgi:Uma2 family endonuclease